MSAKTKRIIYSEADCHTLVDIIISYKNIIECKKTDATTWKEKVAVWKIIADIYNATSVEPRTAEQLRCKYDNLKKELRKFEAQKRQSLYQTGGGLDESNIKASLKLLYAKIKSIISFSVKGLDPGDGDSDMVVDVAEMEQSNTLNPAVDEDIIFDNLPPTTSKEDVAEQKNDISNNYIGGSESECQNILLAPITEALANKSDWSTYTPKMLRVKKHKVLQVKTKATEMETEDDRRSRQNLKQKLMEEEAKRNEEYHIARMRREEEMHNFKIKNINLQNEKLQLEIEILKKQLKNKDFVHS